MSVFLFPRERAVGCVTDDTLNVPDFLEINRAALSEVLRIYPTRKALGCVAP